MQGSFDARQHQPKQAGEGHPIGKGFDFTIINTESKENKDKTGGYLSITFQTPAGTIINNYNLWNNTPKAVEIAHGQLSALCHAVGVFQLSFPAAAELRNARGKLDVGLQKGEAEGGYVEVKKVYDVNGNEPGKANAAPPQQGFGQQQPPAQQYQHQPPAQQYPPQQQQQPMQQQPGGGWGTPQTAGNVNQPPMQPQQQPPQQGYQQPPQGYQQPPAQQPTPGGWTPPAQQQPGNGQQATPPWGK